VCGTTRETSCRGVCCVRFLRFFSLMLALVVLSRVPLLARPALLRVVRRALGTCGCGLFGPRRPAAGSGASSYGSCGLYIYIYSNTLYPPLIVCRVRTYVIIIIYII
jgi:hypothetical protein